MHFCTGVSHLRSAVLLSHAPLLPCVLLIFCGTLVCLCMRASMRTRVCICGNTTQNVARVKLLLCVLFPAAGALYSPRPNYSIICIRGLQEKPSHSLKSQRQMQHLQDISTTSAATTVFHQGILGEIKALHCRLQLVISSWEAHSQRFPVVEMHLVKKKKCSYSVFQWINFVSLILFWSFIYKLQFHA